MSLLSRIRAWFKPRPRLTLALPAPAFSLGRDEADSLRRMQRYERNGLGFPPARKHFERDLPSLLEVTAEAQKQLAEKDREICALAGKLEACETELRITRQHAAPLAATIDEVARFLREEDAPMAPTFYARLRLLARQRKSARARAKPRPRRT